MGVGAEAKPPKKGSTFFGDSGPQEHGGGGGVESGGLDIPTPRFNYSWGHLEFRQNEFTVRKQNCGFQAFVQMGQYGNILVEWVPCHTSEKAWDSLDMV